MPRDTKTARQGQRSTALASGNGYALLLILPTATPPGTVKEVRDAGYIPVLTDEPDKVKLVVAGSEVIGGDMLMAAMHGIVAGGYSDPKVKFTEALYARMQKREGA